MRRLEALGMTLGISLSLLAGCAVRRPSEVTYRDPAMDFSLVRSMAVLPFENLTPVTTAGERVRDVFSTMMQATGSAYVLPPGEVSRGIDRGSLARATEPTPEEAVNLGKLLSVDVLVCGAVREYGEVRSGSTQANVVSVSVRMMETQTGKIVWSASSTKGGVGAGDRLFGGGGRPMDDVTSEAVRDLLDKLFD